MTTEKTAKKPSTSRAALKLRARARNKKPAFLRAESWKYDRFSLSWRRPRGLDNKIRRKIKGWPASPSVGYKGPKIARGLHPSGYREVIVYNMADLSNVDPDAQAIRIAHTVGKRKRGAIIAEAKNLNLKILNVKVSAKTEKTEEETEAESAEEIEEEETKEIEKESATEDLEQAKQEAEKPEKPQKEKKSKDQGKSKKSKAKKGENKQ